MIRLMVKKAFKLPKRTNTAFLHAPPYSGGLGIPCIVDEIDIHMACTAFKLLNSPDLCVKSIAHHHLSIVTAKRTGINDPSIGDMEEFINCSPNPGEGKTGDIKSIWSSVRSSLARCDALMNLKDGKMICKETTITWSSRKKLGRALRGTLLHDQLRILQSASDQGRTFGCVALHPASN